VTGLHVVEFCSTCCATPDPTAGDLGRLADSPAGGRDGLLAQHNRSGIAGRATARYAPDLNPVGHGRVDHLKHVELRNVTRLDLDEFAPGLHLAIVRLRQKPHLARLFLQAAGLLL